MVICLHQDADLNMVKLLLLPLTVSFFSKSRLVILLWYWLILVDLDKGPLTGVVVESIVEHKPAKLMLSYIRL